MSEDLLRAPWGGEMKEVFVEAGEIIEEEEKKEDGF